MTDPWPLNPNDPLSALECSQSGPVPPGARAEALYGAQGARMINARQNLRIYRWMIHDCITEIKIVRDSDEPNVASEARLLGALACYRRARQPYVRRLIAASRGSAHRRVA